MQFIPLDKYSAKNKKKTWPEKRETENIKKFQKNEMAEEMSVKKTKLKLQPKVFGKNVKNKCKETLALKQKERIRGKKTRKEKEEENKNELIKECNKNEDESVVEAEEEEKYEKEVEHDKNIEEEAFKKKCKEMDEKKKNRLFVKLKKKILSDAQIKELHPDIRQVIFPRKKNSRWCWAVFASEERAHAAMKQLIKNKEIFVSKPNPYDRVYKKQKEKMKTVIMKKELRKKLQKMWM